MSSELSISTKGKTGEKKRITVYAGYPYLIFSPEDHGFKSEDKFTLSSDDGSYKEELNIGQSEKGEGYIVLWFPLPPKGKKYSLKVEHPEAAQEIPLKEYFIFENEVLTFRDDEKSTEEKIFIRGKS